VRESKVAGTQSKQSMRGGLTLALASPALDTYASAHDYDDTTSGVASPWQFHPPPNGSHARSTAFSDIVAVDSGEDFIHGPTRLTEVEEPDGPIVPRDEAARQCQRMRKPAMDKLLTYYLGHRAALGRQRQAELLASGIAKVSPEQQEAASEQHLAAVLQRNANSLDINEQEILEDLRCVNKVEEVRHLNELVEEEKDVLVEHLSPTAVEAAIADELKNQSLSAHFIDAATRIKTQALRTAELLQRTTELTQSETDSKSGVFAAVGAGGKSLQDQGTGVRQAFGSHEVHSEASETRQELQSHARILVEEVQRMADLRQTGLNSSSHETKNFVYEAAARAASRDLAEGVSVLRDALKHAEHARDAASDTAVAQGINAGLNAVRTMMRVTGDTAQKVGPNPMLAWLPPAMGAAVSAAGAAQDGQLVVNSVNSASAEGAAVSGAQGPESALNNLFEVIKQDLQNGRFIKSPIKPHGIEAPVLDRQATVLQNLASELEKELESSLSTVARRCAGVSPEQLRKVARELKEQAALQRDSQAGEAGADVADDPEEPDEADDSGSGGWSPDFSNPLSGMSTKLAKVFKKTMARKRFKKLQEEYAKNTVTMNDLMKQETLRQFLFTAERLHPKAAEVTINLQQGALQRVATVGKDSAANSLDEKTPGESTQKPALSSALSSAAAPKPTSMAAATPSSFFTPSAPSNAHAPTGRPSLRAQLPGTAEYNDRQRVIRLNKYRRDGFEDIERVANGGAPHFLTPSQQRQKNKDLGNADGSSWDEGLGDMAGRHLGKKLKHTKEQAWQFLVGNDKQNKKKPTVAVYSFPAADPRQRGLIGRDNYGSEFLAPGGDRLKKDEKNWLARGMFG